MRTYGGSVWNRLAHIYTNSHPVVPQQYEFVWKWGIPPNGSVITGNMVTDPNLKFGGALFSDPDSLTGESQDRDRCDGQTFSWRDHHAPWPCRKVGTGDHGLDHRMLRRKSQPYRLAPPTIRYKPPVIGLAVWLPSYLTDWRPPCL